MDAAICHRLVLSVARRSHACRANVCFVLEIPTWGQIAVGKSMQEPKPAIADDSANAASLKFMVSIIVMCL